MLCWACAVSVAPRAVSSAPLLCVRFLMQWYSQKLLEQQASSFKFFLMQQEPWLQLYPPERQQHVSLPQFLRFYSANLLLVGFGIGFLLHLRGLHCGNLEKN